MADLRRMPKAGQGGTQVVLLTLCRNLPLLTIPKLLCYINYARFTIFNLHSCVSWGVIYSTLYVSVYKLNNRPDTDVQYKCIRIGGSFI